jgi:hypothetical protein
MCPRYCDIIPALSQALNPVTCACSEPREALVEAERALLVDTLALLEEVCPALEERALLADALKQLDELFLLVIVGEFNSGKSSVRLLPPKP